MTKKIQYTKPVLRNLAIHERERLAACVSGSRNTIQNVEYICQSGTGGFDAPPANTYCQGGNVASIPMNCSHGDVDGENVFKCDVGGAYTGTPYGPDDCYAGNVHFIAPCPPTGAS